MSYFMGLDGGGSNLRVIITDAAMQVLVHVQREGVNPGSVGQERAAIMIQDAIGEAVSQLQADTPITAVGIGIAGASATHAGQWLYETIKAVLPQSHVVPSSDLEIALVGAHGARQGVLLLAGTGSAAFGIDSSGQSFQLGGWGYLLGDEGSGYWLGLHALQLLTQYADGLIEMPSTLPETVMQALHLDGPRAVIKWLYGAERVPVREVAKLAALVIDVAEEGDVAAQDLCEHAAVELIKLGKSAMKRAGGANIQVAFAGGLLDSSNRISREVMKGLGLKDFPVAMFSPVVGAALLAKIDWLKETQ